jgi:small subunit ribosomal protein S4
MLIGPKYKICKRLGSAVFEKCQTQKYQLAETRAPRKTARRGGSAFGAQLLEKQKARFIYGLSESQFARYVKEAMEKKGADSMQGLVSRLESRLDNVIFRAGFVKTRRAARQLVSHGHVWVNGKRMNVPSYMVAAGDTVSIRTESRGSALFANRAQSAAEYTAPAWLTISPEGFDAQILATPGAAVSELPWSPSTIIQFYSR